jgi:hypothetical protein
MCFGLVWFEQFLVWLVIVCAIVALLRLVIGFVVPRLGLDGGIVAVVVRALTIIMWAIVCIAVIYFIFGLIECLVGGGVGVLRFPGAR